jgi:hypothetical protein
MARYIDIEKAEYPYMSMSMWGVNSKDCKIYNEGVKATEDMITALPTADVVEVKHGEWMPIVKQDDYLEPPYCDTIKCSECGQEADASFHNAKYCFECGAKMDGGNAE